MKTITQRLMKILLVTLMMIIPLGINNSVVYAEDSTVIDTIEFTVTPPIAGDIVTMTGNDKDTQNPYPHVSIPSNASYELDEEPGYLPAYWQEEKGVYFTGTFVEGKDYYAKVWLRPKAGYKFTEELNVTANNKTIKEDGDDENYSLEDWTSICVLVKVQCKPAPQTKELAAGVEYKIGDTIELSSNVYIDFDDRDFTDNSDCKLSYKGTYTLPGPRFDEEWIFDPEITVDGNTAGFMFSTGSISESNPPIGIKCIGGDGKSKDSAFKFELLFATSTDPTVIDEITFTITPPAPGVEVEVTGDDKESQTPRPVINIPDNAPFALNGNNILWITYEQKLFKGTFVDGQEYYVIMILKANEGYNFADELSFDTNCDVLDYGHTANRDLIEVYAKIKCEATAINTIEFTITPPVAGVTVSGGWEDQDPRPEVTIPNNAPFKVERKSYVTGPAIEDKPFEGKFEEGKDYYVSIKIKNNEGFEFPDAEEDLTVNVINGEFANWIEYDESLQILVVKVKCPVILKEGAVYYEGDFIQVSEKAYIDLDGEDIIEAAIGRYKLPKPKTMSNGDLWRFEDFIAKVGENNKLYGIYLSGDDNESNPPIGIKCVEGDGKSEDTAFKFELLYDTPLASKVKAIQLNIDGQASNLIGAQESSIYFGNYPQSKADSVEGLTEGKHFINVDEWNYLIEPIKWRVLSNEYNSTTEKQELFLLSDMVLEPKPYHSEWKNITWEDSSIRSWLNQNDSSTDSDARPGLNDGFLGSAFSDDEQKAILTSTVINDDNPNDDEILGGDDTEDKIFLLSIDEVLDIDAALEEENIDKVDEEKYGFTDSASRQAKATTYAISKGVYNQNNYAYYWLRSSGGLQGHAAIVYEDGSVDISGSFVAYASLGVRPAFKINLESVLFTSSAEGIKAQSSLGLKGISETTTSDWKLTLLDDTRKFEATQTGTTKDTYEAGDTLSFTYEEAKTGKNEYISAILTDDKDNVLYYGRLLQPTSATSTSETLLNVTLPDNLEDGNYKLRIFNEQYNGGDNDDNLTDYASNFSTTVLTISNTVTPVTYEILEGNNASWSKGSTSTLDFRCARTPEITFDEYKTLLTSVQVDEKVTTEYEIASGSIIIKLKPELLEKLSIDTHTITINFNDGRSVSANFTVKAKGSSSTPSYTIPKTGVE